MTKNDFEAIEFLSRLRELGIELRAENDKLRIDAPTGALTESLREALSQQKTELLRLLTDSATQDNKDVPLQRVPRDGHLRLSFSQERLWFLSQLEPENVAYNISGSVRIGGRVQVDILNKSLSEIIRRHEILRTTFNEIDGKPVQVVLRPTPFVLQRVDLQRFSEPERKERVRRVAIEEAQRPFDLSKGPLFRAALVILGTEEYLLFITMHHIITDRWSLAVFAEELKALYQAFSGEKPSPLPELPVQYADFAAWQRQRLWGENLSTQIEFWKKKLSVELPILQLPTDRTRPAVQTYNGAIQAFNLPVEISERLKLLSQRQGVTMFMTLLAGFKVLLYRYTGQTDIAVGSPIANRTRAELEVLIGLFVNTLVLRTDLSGNPSFVELLGRVRETTLGAYEHQDAPFEKVVELLNPARDMSYSPLFQVMFVFQNVPIASGDLTRFTFTETGASMFDLTLYMWEGEKGLSGTIEYNTDLFDAGTIERMVGNFRMLLESIVADPNRRLSELVILTEPERRQLLIEWNATEAVYPADKTLVQLFEEQAGRRPEAIAVVFGDEQLTYRQLNRRANQLASYLRKLGVGPDVLVGICMERSADMAVGLLGVLKAGGAYVPLDPSFPMDRLQFMLEDSGLPILLTQLAHSGDWAGYQGKIVCVDSDWKRISTESEVDPTPLSVANHLAYVIYTSGSTGRPKGVQIPHRGLVNFLYSMRRKPGLSSEDTVLSVTTISFDIFGLELFLPLVTGAKVVLVERDDAADGARLIELLKESGASVMQATPATWRLLLQAGWEGERSLKVLCGGEALPQDLVAPLLDRCKEFWNLYGPTETTIWSTVYQIKSKEDPILIGSPIANTQVYILDPSLQPVPVGVVGELHIGGDGLAWGYLNRPELTEERFIPDPFSGEAGARIYKTGDLARYRPDGNIECLGRVDHQVKVRGFRIELGEIESALSKHNGVKQAVVIVREDVPGDKRLVAYVVAKEGTAPSVSELRSFLRGRLPNYMVPAAFMSVDSMPLTPNGKVDVMRLSSLKQLQTDRKHLSDKPLTEMEKTVIDIWIEALGLDHISVHDNFFELGGHSLLSIQVIARLEKRIGLRINVGELIYQTLGQLAASLERRTGDLTPSMRPVTQNRLLQAIKNKLFRLEHQE